MKALVYHGPGRSSWEEVPDPTIRDPGDAIVRVGTATVCATDLLILRGRLSGLPGVSPGTVLGHEAVGDVVEVGPGVRGVRPGERVVVTCVAGCGRCRACRSGSYGQCRGGGGWVLGRAIDGTQAEYVRVPFADLATHVLPNTVSDQDAILLADVLPTAYEAGVCNGRVRPGDTVVVVGAGPVGLATVATARLLSPGRIIVIEPTAARRDAAGTLGADVVGDPAEQPEALVDDLTGGLGADVVIEAVGRPDTFELCTRLVRPGGRVANVGVHSAPATLHLEDLWHRNVTLTTALVDGWSVPTLLPMLADGRLPVAPLVTHDFQLDQVHEAYQAFAAPAETGALKVALRAAPGEARALVVTERVKEPS